MGPTWVLSAPDGTHIGPMNLAISDYTNMLEDTAADQSAYTAATATAAMEQWNNEQCLSGFIVMITIGAGDTYDIQSFKVKIAIIPTMHAVSNFENFSQEILLKYIATGRGSSK